MSILKNLVLGATALTGTVQAQVALDQTKTQTGKQIYETIAFANGSLNASPHPSYSIVGTINIDTGISDSFGLMPGFWRAGTFIDTHYISGTVIPTTVGSEVVGNTIISWDQANALQKTVNSDANNLGINYNGIMKRARADTNGDGIVDSQITTYELPTGTDAQIAGFLPGDIAIFATPNLLAPNGTDVLPSEASYKTLNANYTWDDTLNGPTGWSQMNIIDWVSGTMGTNEVEAIQMSIYPNPATDTITLQFKNNDRADEYHLYSASGQHVGSGKNLNSKDHIDVSNLHAGAYILQLKIGDKMLTKKFIKK